MKTILEIRDRSGFTIASLENPMRIPNLQEWVIIENKDAEGSFFYSGNVRSIKTSIITEEAKEDIMIVSCDIE